MPTKKGADLRPGDLLIYGHEQPVRLSEVIWTTAGLYFTTDNNAAKKPLDPGGDYRVAAPLPTASMEWDDDAQAWVIEVRTPATGDPWAPPTQVLVEVDGKRLTAAGEDRS